MGALQNLNSKCLLKREAAPIYAEFDGPEFDPHRPKWVDQPLKSNSAESM